MEGLAEAWPESNQHTDIRSRVSVQVPPRPEERAFWSIEQSIGVGDENVKEVKAGGVENALERDDG
jgi:hypothetical protein